MFAENRAEKYAYGGLRKEAGKRGNKRGAQTSLTAVPFGGRAMPGRRAGVVYLGVYTGRCTGRRTGRRAGALFGKIAQRILQGRRRRELVAAAAG